jgi:drug/metabolite transporter (DMT)-like permease
MASSEPADTLAASLWMIVAGLAYAGMGACIKLASARGVPVAQITFYRSLISLLAVWAYLRLRGTTLATPHWRNHLARSLTGVGSLAAYFSAITLLPLATAMTLSYTSPLFVAIIMFASRTWQPRRLMLLTVLVGFCGVALLLRPTVDRTQWLGLSLAVTSAALSAGSVLTLRRLGQLGESTWRTVFFLVLSATVLTFPWYLSSAPWRPMTSMAALFVLGVGLLATLGQLLITLSYQRGETLVSACLGYSQVLFAVLLGWWIWREGPTGEAWVGIPLIIGSGIGTVLQGPANRK